LIKAGKIIIAHLKEVHRFPKRKDGYCCKLLGERAEIRQNLIETTIHEAAKEGPFYYER